MPLLQRRLLARDEAKPIGDTENTKKSRDHRSVLRIVLVVIASAGVVVLGQKRDSFNGASSTSDANKTPGTAFGIDSGISVIVEFDQVEADSKTKVSLGPHKATLILPEGCGNPGLWLRAEGDALASVVLEEVNSIWRGLLTFPVEGNFSLVAFWYGCDGSSALQKRQVLTTVQAKDTRMLDGSNHSLFPPSAWISSKKFPQATGILQPYVLHNPRIPTGDANLIKTSDSFVAEQSATFPETHFYQFNDLSNYELVCWIGSESADLVRASFLQLRSLVSRGQRPFKFHMYDSKSFNSPDVGWSEDKKKGFRKCKHILVSMDEVETPVTQIEYIQQVTSFISHLLKAFPDDTFPIWMFATMESPTKPTNCLNPSLPRSSDHPCNTALRDLFRKKSFPERVRFLDTTEITLPQLGENPKDVATAIALRIFVFVGKQVAEWRAKGQAGGIKGLKRGDYLEPNFELVPYTGWGQ